MIRDTWFFQDPAETMSSEYALESVVLADTVDGDQVIFHRGTRQLHVLPRHDDRTHAAGADLWDVVTWFQESGVLTRPHPFRYFEALVGPVEAANGSGNQADHSRVIDAFDALRIHDELELNESDRTYFVKSIGGFITVFGSGDSVYTHIRYRPDQAPDVRARLWSTAESAGITWGEPWLTVPHDPLPQ